MGCYACMKFLFVFLNIIFLILGISGVGVIVWILLDPTIPLHFTQGPDDFMIATIIYLAVAVMLILLSVLGIYSVTKEVKWALVMSFSLLLIVIVVEVASGVWIWVNRNNLDEFTHASIKDSIQKDYDANTNMREIVDAIQSKMHCCGADNPTDWSRKKDVNMAINSKTTTYNIPSSCCREGIVPTQCLDVTQNVKMGENPNIDVIYPKGCYLLIKQRVVESLTDIFIIFGSVVGVKVLGLLIGLILAFSMNRANRYKG